MARQRGFGPLTYGLEGRCSIQLSYWRTCEIFYIIKFYFYRERNYKKSLSKFYFIRLQKRVGEPRTLFKGRFSVLLLTQRRCLHRRTLDKVKLKDKQKYGSDAGT